MKAKTLLLLFFALFGLYACLEDEVDVRHQYYTPEEYTTLERYLDLPEEPHDYSVVFPAHLQMRGLIPPSVSRSMATLGRVLFYDTHLSRNNEVSCASCHKQTLAFSDDKALSVGFKGETTRRNSLALAAAANLEASYNDPFSGSNSARFFWDERAHSISEQSRLSIEDPVEMGMSFGELEEKLREVPYYPILFRRAYGSDEITESRIVQALEHFVNAFVSIDSRFDEGMAMNQGNPHRNFGNFNESENRGKALYQQHCASCHSPDLSTLRQAVANNGLDEEYSDPGLGDITNRQSDVGVFKVPFLRNIALTAPYMHDGRFATLEEVVEHYNSGIQDHPNLSPLLKDPTTSLPKRLHLTAQEKADLVAFLHTLTDQKFASEVRFSDPFK